MALREQTFHVHLNGGTVLLVCPPYREPSQNVSTIVVMAYGFEWSGFQPRFFIYLLCHSRIFFFFYMKMYISITEFQGLNTFISQILCEHFLSTGGTEMNKNNGLLLDLREFMF